MKTNVLSFGGLGVAVAGVLLAGALSGCAWSIGGEKEGGPVVHEPTQGQQLIDLKRAYDQGVLTAEEYEREKREVLDR